MHVRTAAAAAASGSSNQLFTNYFKLTSGSLLPSIVSGLGVKGSGVSYLYSHEVDYSLIKAFNPKVITCAHIARIGSAARVAARVCVEKS